MSVLNELSLPFLKMGGYMVAYKQGNISKEIEDSLPGLKLLGGELDRIYELNIPNIKQGRKIVLIKKIYKKYISSTGSYGSTTFYP